MRWWQQFPGSHLCPEGIPLKVSLKGWETPPSAPPSPSELCLLFHWPSWVMCTFLTNRWQRDGVTRSGLGQPGPTPEMEPLHGAGREGSCGGNHTAGYRCSFLACWREAFSVWSNCWSNVTSALCHFAQLWGMLARVAKLDLPALTTVYIY